MRLLALRFLVNGSLMLAVTWLQGIWSDSLHALVLPALLLVLVNALLPLLMVLLAFPLTLPSIGLTTLLANLLLLVGCDRLLPSFHAQGILTVLGAATLIAGANYLLNWLAYRQPAVAAR